MPVKLTVAPDAGRGENDDGYPRLERLVRDRLTAAKGPLFTTDCDGTVEFIDGGGVSVTGLAADFLYGLADDRKGHYTCRCCLNFINRYGSLVTIGPDGNASPAVWDY